MNEASSLLHRRRPATKPGSAADGEYFLAKVQMNLILMIATGFFVTAATVVSAAEIPSSLKSRNIVSRQSMQLQPDLVKKGFVWGAPVFLRIFKQEKQLELWLMDGQRFRMYKRYSICTFGGRGLGPKTAQGDHRAPEGFYFVAPRQLNPFSRYHLAFNLGYPNAYDRTHGRTGGALMVHGGCVSVGCYAMSDRWMEQIYTLVVAALRNGQPFFRVHIFPCRMSSGNMRKLARSRWYPFWENLKQGYDIFQSTAVPPDVQVQNGRYTFRSTARLSSKTDG